VPAPSLLPRSRSGQHETRTQTKAEYRRAPDGNNHARLAQNEWEIDAAPNNLLVFRGYATVFGTKYTIADKIGVGVAGEVCPRQDPWPRNCDTTFLLNHSEMSLARTNSGTLKLSTDSTGPQVEARLHARSQQVEEIKLGVERRDLSEMSFAFVCVRSQRSGDFSERQILQADIENGAAVRMYRSPVRRPRALSTLGGPGEPAESVCLAGSPLFHFSFD
jgi:phage head maturation protease